jgi:hypothetical protein
MIFFGSDLWKESMAFNEIYLDDDISIEIVLFLMKRLRNIKM